MVRRGRLCCGSIFKSETEWKMNGSSETLQMRRRAAGYGCECFVVGFGAYSVYVEHSGVSVGASVCGGGWVCASTSLDDDHHRDQHYNH